MGFFLPIITDFILLSYLYPDTLNYQDIVVVFFRSKFMSYKIGYRMSFNIS
jgi:hypothetical protein